MSDSRFHLDEWKIIETRFEPDRARDSESIFALGNGMRDREPILKRHIQVTPCVVTMWLVSTILTRPLWAGGK
jgi:hypothetical protein